MILPEFEKLWEKYSEGGTVTLGQARAWLLRQAAARRFEPEVVDQAMFMVMAEVARGKHFALNGCNCGCGLKDPHTTILHYMGKVMIELGRDVEFKRSKAMANAWEGAIALHVERDNQQFIAANMPPEEPSKKTQLWRTLTKPRTLTKYWSGK